jgi:hypothetical protein
MNHYITHGQIFGIQYPGLSLNQVRNRFSRTLRNFMEYVRKRYEYIRKRSDYTSNEHRRRTFPEMYLAEYTEFLEGIGEWMLTYTNAICRIDSSFFVGYPNTGSLEKRQLTARLRAYVLEPNTLSGSAGLSQYLFGAYKSSITQSMTSELIQWVFEVVTHGLNDLSSISAVNVQDFNFQTTPDYNVASSVLGLFLPAAIHAAFHTETGFVMANLLLLSGRDLFVRVPHTDGKRLLQVFLPCLYSLMYGWEISAKATRRNCLEHERGEFGVLVNKNQEATFVNFIDFLVGAFPHLNAAAEKFPAEAGQVMRLLDSLFDILGGKEISFTTTHIHLSEDQRQYEELATVLIDDMEKNWTVDFQNNVDIAMSNGKVWPHQKYPYDFDVTTSRAIRVERFQDQMIRIKDPQRAQVMDRRRAVGFFDVLF